MLKKVLLVTPFKYDSEQLNVGVDPVVLRHAGQQIKTGYTYPIGLAYIGALLEKYGYEVKLVDPVAEKTKVDKVLEAADWSDVIVLPLSASHMKDTKRFMRDYKDKVRIIVGGYAKHVPDHLFGDDVCDFVVYGEPEMSILELLQNYPNAENVEGIIYLSGGQQKTNPSRMFMADLDELPFPARHLNNPKIYWDISFFGKATAWILTSRGCPYDCIFCSEHETYGRKVRFRDPIKVVDEIEHIYTEHEIRHFVFFDSNFNINNKHVSTICNEILKRKLKIKWWCAGRADLIKKDVLLLMKKAGCTEIRIGLESADDAILEYFHKEISIDKFLDGIAVLKKVGMRFSLHCIFGSPMETEETIKKTMDLVKRIRPLYVSFNLLTPLPGSQLFLELKEQIDPGKIKSFDLVSTDYSISKYSNSDLHMILRKAYLSYYLSAGFTISLTKYLVKNPLMLWGMLKTLARQGLYVKRSIIK